MTLFVYCDLFMVFKEWWRHMLVKLVVIEGRGRCEFLITCARAGFGWRGNDISLLNCCCESSHTCFQVR